MKRLGWISVAILALPLSASAQADGFVPLIGIPGLTAESYTVNTYLDALYVLTISLAAFLVVVRLMLGGFQYMLTDIVPQKEQAKKSIRNALLGLLVILGAVLILNTINPELTNLNGLNIRPISVAVSGPYGEAVVTSRPDTGLDGVEDVTTIRPAELTEIVNNCENPSEGTPGRFVIRGDGSASCLGNESLSAADNVLNRPETLNTYITANGLTTAEADNLRARYNQFVATQEPAGLTPEIVENIRNAYDAEEVLFVVNPVQIGSAQALAGYFDNQVALCQELTGSDNIVEDRSAGYVACLR